MKITTGHGNTYVAARLDAMPNQPKTPARAARISDEMWLPFVAKAQRRGQTATDRIRELIATDLAEDIERDLGIDPETNDI